MPVDFALAPEDEAFRDELRGWLDEHLSPFLASEELVDDTSITGEKSTQRRAAWQRLLNEGRWAAVNCCWRAIFKFHLEKDPCVLAVTASVVSAAPSSKFTRP